MNKKVIGFIIGLMSAAVIGVVWLQMDLIYTTMRENEKKFEENISDALLSVVDQLEKDEQQRSFDFMINGHALQEGFLSFNKNDGLNKIGILNGNYMEIDHLVINQRDKKLLNIQTRTSMSLKAEGLPLEDRINLDRLKTIIDQELTNKNIKTDYEYGIFSRKKNNFIIVNNHFVYNDDQSGAYSYRALKTSTYFKHLFPKESPSPGKLMIYFPAKDSVVWSSLWLNLIGTILFAGIILSSFAYTIYVIFRQKKLGEMKNDFINNMTHEFKTPIATISLAADSITSPIIAGKPDKVSRFANIIKQENKRMNSQVEKVLQMALIDKKDFSLKLTEVNLHDIIARAVENISLQVEKKEGSVQAIMDATNPIVECDLTHVSNVINNLLDNANKYSPERPEISVSTRNVGNGVEVIVKDKGIGMSKEARKHIFDKFYRVHTGNLHDVKGFGLGLSYVKAIMTAHKGQIDVKSELGKGSSFILHFPFHVRSSIMSS